MRHLPLAALGLLLASPAVAQEMPPRKAGLWEVKMTLEGAGMPPQTSHQCVDAETDKLMNTVGSGMSKDMCSKQEVKRVGGNIIIDSVCTMGGMTMTSNGVVTGDFNSAYTMKMTSKRQGGPPQAGPAETKMQLDAKWVGPCKADQKPGDIIMPGGRKMNIRDLQNMPGMPGGPPPAAPPRK